MRFRQISNDRVVDPNKAIMLTELIKDIKAKREEEKKSTREHVEHMKEQSRSYDRRIEKRENDRKEADRRESEEENRRRERYYQDRKEWNSWE